MSKEELNTCLKYFYTSARKQDGSSYYKASSLKTIRAAVDCHLRSPPHNKQFSIVSDAAFIEANRVLFAFVKDLKKSGKIEGVVHRRAITKEQLQKLYASGQLGPANSNDPAQLQRTVWFYLGLYFGRRGRENQRDLKKEMLVLRSTPQGMEYFELNRPMPTSVSTINVKDDSDAKIIFSSLGSPRCPVTTIKKYLYHLDPPSSVLFQRKRIKFSPKSAIWYGPAPLGKHSLEYFMKEMSKKAGIEPSLTKNCLRSTALSIISGSNCVVIHKDNTETAVFATHSQPLSFVPKQSSNLLSDFLASEGPSARIISPLEQTVIATMIEIEQQQNSEGEMVFHVRKVPIVARQHNQMSFTDPSIELK